jgi:membrane fusion protein, copper/silver efflux system
MNIRDFISPILMLVLMLAGCSKPGPAVSARNDVDYYTCTMHPWVHSKKPGTCPVCGMDLVPVYKNKPQSEQSSQSSASSKSMAQPESHNFDVPVERQQQFGVTYAQAKR